MTFAVVDTGRPHVPEYSERENAKGYVNYGTDNQFPQFVHMLYTESTSVGAIIDGSVRYLVGNGVVTESTKWKDKVNRKGDTLDDIVEALGTDLMTYGGFALQVIYSKLFTVSEIYALDFARCRTNETGTKIYYAPKWGGYTTKYDVYDAFNREKIDPEKMTQIFYFKGSVRSVYPRPSWLSAFRDALSEVEASKMQLNQLSNQLMAKTLITLPNDSSQLTPDDKRLVEKSIKDKFTGPDATSSFMIYWREEGMQDLRVDSIKNEDDTDKFVALKKSARENIFVAFKAQPNLFGLMTESKGFSKEEYQNAVLLYDRIQMAPLRKKILNCLKEVLCVDDLKVLPFNLQLEEE